jgi:Flp pilus assembly protein TadD
METVKEKRQPAADESEFTAASSMTDVDRQVNTKIASLDQQGCEHYKCGRFGECVEVLRVAYQLRRLLLGRFHIDTLLNLNNLAAALGRHGMLPEAEEAFREALTGRIEVRGANHPDCFTTMSHLAVVLRQVGQFEEADVLLYSALEGFHSQRGVRDICTAEAAFAFGVLAVLQGKRNKAAYLFSMSVVGLLASIGASHQHTRDAQAWAAKCADTYRDKEDKSPTAGQGGRRGAASRTHGRGVPSPFAPLLSAFDLDDLDGTEGCYASKKHWQHGSQCGVCSVAYTMKRREHHCRVCATSVCDDCSPSTAYVLEFGMKSKQRMCATCEAQGFA